MKFRTLIAAAIGFCLLLASNHIAQASAKPVNEAEKTHTASQVAHWQQRKINDSKCSISPIIDNGAGWELNHHRVTVDYTGNGTVKLAIASGGDRFSLEKTLEKKFKSRFYKATNGKELPFPANAKMRSRAWLLVQTTGNVSINSIKHKYWQGWRTVYGHSPGYFPFRGKKLPFRLKLPRNYDPSKSYPLVISLHGSGGMGSNNMGSMEPCTLARYLFTKYYDDNDLNCFSLISQVPKGKEVPPPFWPRGRLGAPDKYHPTYPTINENSWYTLGTLRLVSTLIRDPSLNIDPDRVYLGGYSLGGKGCWEFLKAGREVFAGAISCAGWPIGRPYTTPQGKLIDRLKLEVMRYKHIPVHVLVGGKDKMRFGSKAVHKEIVAQGGRSTYVEFPNTGHGSSAAWAWGNRKYMRWLFKQNRKNNPKPGKDPFPHGQYPENNVPPQSSTVNASN